MAAGMAFFFALALLLASRPPGNDSPEAGFARDMTERKPPSVIRGHYTPSVASAPGPPYALMHRSAWKGNSANFAGKIEPYDLPLRTYWSMCGVERIPN